MAAINSIHSIAPSTGSTADDPNYSNTENNVIKGDTRLCNIPKQTNLSLAENITSANIPSDFEAEVVVDHDGNTIVDSYQDGGNAIIIATTEDASHPGTMVQPKLLVWNIDEPEKQVLVNEPSTNNETNFKSCCGKSCQLESTELCCEHSFFTYTNPREYCRACKQRYLSANGDKDTDIACSPCSQTPPNDEDQERDLLPFERIAQICQTECPICLLDFSVISSAICILPCAHAICHGHRHQIQVCPLCCHPVDDYGAEAGLASGVEQSLESMTQTERYDIINNSE